MPSFRISVDLANRPPNDGYDKATHKYRDDFIQGTNYQLRIFNDDADALARLTTAYDALRQRLHTAELQHKPTVETLEELVKKALEKIHKVEQTLAGQKFVIRHLASGWTSETTKYQLEVPHSGAYSLTHVHESGSTVHEFEIIEQLIVVLGDSVGSGEGNPHRKQDSSLLSDLIDEIATPLSLASRRFTIAADQWQEPLAHRSSLSGFNALRKLNIGTRHYVFKTLNFSRSGDSIRKGILEAHDAAEFMGKYGPNFISSGGGLPKPSELSAFRNFLKEHGDYLVRPQLDEAVTALQGRPIDFLFLSGGANDVSWASIISEMMKWGDGATASASKKLLDGVTGEAFDALKVRFDTMNVRHVVLAGYPQSAFGDMASDGSVVQRSCGAFKGAFLNISDNEMQIVRLVADKLRAVLSEVCAKNKWSFLENIGSRFSAHGYCAKDTYFVSAMATLKGQGDKYGVLHPNQSGHAVYAEELASAVTNVLSR